MNAVARLRSFASSPCGWALFVVVVAAALLVGSLRPSVPDAAGRIAYLDSVIKCPSCADLSIAESNAGIASALRGEVTRLVDRGWSTARVETRIEGQYGSDEILSPHAGAVWVVPLVAGIGGLVLIVAVFVVRSRRTRRRAGPGDEALVRRALARSGGG